MTIPHNTRYVIVANADGSYDTFYATGGKPPAGPSITLDTAGYIALIGSLTNRPAGTTVSFNLAALVSGPGAAGTTFTIVTVSGNDAAAAGWVMTGAVLSNTGVANAGGVFDVVAIDPQNNAVAFPSSVWSFVATGGGADVMAPTVPTGVNTTPATNAIVLQFDSAGDNYDAANAPGGVHHYNVYKTSVSAANKLSPPSPILATALNKGQQLAVTSIGGSSPAATAVQLKQQWTITAAGVGFYTPVVSDEFEFLSAQLSGDQAVSALLDGYTSAFQYSLFGLMVRDSLAPNAPFVCIYLHPGTAGIRVMARLTMGAAATNVGELDSVTGPVRFRIDRVSNLFTCLYSTDGSQWNILTSVTVGLAQVAQWGIAASSRNAGVSTTFVVHDINLSVKPTVSASVSTTVGLVLGATAVDVAGNESAGSLFVVGSPTAIVTGGATKLLLGNGFWPNNQFWNGADQQVYRNSILPLMRSNPLIKYVCIPLTWDFMEGARGNYTAGFAIVDGILADLAAITSSTGVKRGLILKLWQTFFNTTNPNAGWPAYVVANGWTQAFVQNGNNRTQLKWDIDDIWTAQTAMFQAYADRYDPHANFFGLGIGDESEAVSVTDAKVTVINSTHYNAKYQQLYLDIKAHLPHTLAYAPMNFLPPGGPQEITDMSTMINAWLAAYPGGFLLGGPDPCTHSTTFHKMMCGLVGTTGDIRGKVAMLNNVEQGGETASNNPTATTIYTVGIGQGAAGGGGSGDTPGACQVMMWPYIPDGAAGQRMTLSTMLAAITARNGQVAPLPTVGSYITT